METLRLRRMQESSRVERLLEAYISRAGNLPFGAYQLRDQKELPRSLRTILAQAVERGEVWSCWASGYRLWLFVAHMPFDRSREHGAPVIELRVYDENAELMDSGAWTFGPRGTWMPADQCGGTVAPPETPGARS